MVMEQCIRRVKIPGSGGGGQYPIPVFIQRRIRVGVHQDHRGIVHWTHVTVAQKKDPVVGVVVGYKEGYAPRLRFLRDGGCGVYADQYRPAQCRYEAAFVFS
ncbi:hypothetical protein AGMMS49579_13270 [Spirochaetia bacterium]|nr:hypothetical protein AGMMS49579_13270 [Spirochaetia bacterium]